MATYTSSGSGNWSAATTWGGAGVPTDGDTVTIASGHTVTYDVNIATSGLAALTITGDLVWSTDGTARTLKMAVNANISGTGNLTVGSPSTPIPAPGTSTPEVATIEFQGTGYFAMTGSITMTGEQRDGRDTAAQAELSTSTQVTLTTGGWGVRAGDIIIIARQLAGTYATEHTVQSVAGNVLTLTAQLGRAVAAGDYIALKSRNIAVIGTNASLCRTFGNSSAAGGIAVTGVEFRTWQSVFYGYPGGLAYVDAVSYCSFYNTVNYYVMGSVTGMVLDRCVFYRMGPMSGYSNTMRRSLVFYAGVNGNGHVVQDCVFANSTYGTNLFSGQMSRCTFYYCSDGVYGITGDCELDACVFSGCSRDLRNPGSSSGYTLAGLVQLRNCLLGGATEFLNYVNGNNAADFCVMSRDHDQVAGALKFWSAGGYGYRQSPVQRSGRDTLQFIGESATVHNRAVWEMTVEAGATLTIDVWCSALNEWTTAPTAYLCYSTQEPIVDDACTPLDSDVVDEFYSGSGDRTWHQGQLQWTNTGSDAAQVLLILAGRDASATCYWDWDVQSASGGGVAFPLGL